MKIADSDQIKQIIPPEPRKTKKTGTKGFDAILDENVKTMSTAKAGTAKTQAVKSVAPVFTPAMDREEVASRVMKFLDAMDEYAEKLGSANVSLKEMSPLIARIEMEKNDLQKISETLSPMDEMKGIVDEVLVRSTVEVIKFNRGDYV